MLETATSSNNANNTDIDNQPTNQPITNQPTTPVNSATTSAIQPITPLKQDRKRPRADTIDPQKPARPTSKEDSEALRQGLYFGLRDGLNFIQQASITNPGYSFYGELIDSLKNAIMEVEGQKPNQTQVPSSGLGTSSWAKVASKASNTDKPKDPIKAPKAKAKKTTQKESKEDQQVILKLRKDPIRPILPSHTLRNNLNKTIGNTAIISVELSGNILITTNKPYSASQLLAKVEDWKDLFKEYPIEAIEKLLVGLN